MYLRYSFLLSICLACLTACREAPILENFDTTVWKNDRLGCKGQRATIFPHLSSQKDKIKGLGQNQVLQMLGKPDFHELASRNQRFYIYYYKQGKQCEKGGKVNINQDKILRIRFDALDRVNEITY